MNIDFAKLLKLLLPTFMRNGLTELIASVSAQFTQLYDDFKAWQIDIRLQAAMTCQVMYLEAILNYRLLGSFIRIITISDGDGVTVDFVINQPSGVIVDNFRMISLIEKYKTYGKRYRIDQVQYDYQVSWTDSVCELEQELVNTYEIAWTGPICEQEFTAIENNITCIVLDGTIKATADYNVASSVEVSVFVVYNGGSHEDILLTIPLNNFMSNLVSRSDIQSVTITSVSPIEDTQYIYTYGL